MVILFQSVLVLTGLFFFLPKKAMHLFASVLVFLLVLISSIWAFNCLKSGEVIEITFQSGFWQSNITFTIDALTAFFILVINFSMITAVIYAKGYLQKGMEKKSNGTVALHFVSLVWVHAAMLQVTMIREGVGFLLVWELMALSSFALVIYDGDKKEVMKAGINYLIQMHVGYFLLLIGFFVLSAETGNMSFGALTTYFSTHNNFWLFLLFFGGFGIKAGFIPLHSWLPHAHPAAPTHVSALMSGVIIKMGIYGILRIVLSLQSSFAEISIFIIAISLISGIVGVILAIYQHDLKRLLAYHSIENIGIIGLGIGVGLLGRVVDNQMLSILGFAGGLLHVFNHSLFKTSLFYAAGSIYHATGTRDVNQLGGLIKAMPITGIVFLISALAICGLPPFNGFISEFMIYYGSVSNLSHAGFYNALTSVLVIGGLTVIGGLAVFCFTKVFGISFLGHARSSYPETLQETPRTMWIPGVLVLVMIVSIGMFPAFFTSNIVQILDSAGFVEVSVSDNQTILQALSGVGKANIIFIALVIFVVLVKRWQQKKVVIAQGPTWGCGYQAGDFRHQYTSTSYADNLRPLVAPFVEYERKYEPIEELEIFPQIHSFATHSTDKIEKYGIEKPINFIKKWLPEAGLAQTGMINHYLMYPILFIIIIGLLTIFQVL